MTINPNILALAIAAAASGGISSNEQPPPSNIVTTTPDSKHNNHHNKIYMGLMGGGNALTSLSSDAQQAVNHIKETFESSRNDPPKVLDYRFDSPHEKRLVRLDRNCENSTIVRLGAARYHIATTAELQQNLDYEKNMKFRQHDIRMETNPEACADSIYFKEIPPPQWSEAGGYFDADTGKPLDPDVLYKINTPQDGDSYDLDGRQDNPQYTGSGYYPDENSADMGSAENRPLSYCISVGNAGPIQYGLRAAKIVIDEFRADKDHFVAIDLFVDSPKAFHQNGLTIVYNNRGTEMAIIKGKVPLEEIKFQYHDGKVITPQQGNAAEIENLPDGIKNIKGLLKEAQKLLNAAAREQSGLTPKKATEIMR